MNIEETNCCGIDELVDCYIAKSSKDIVKEVFEEYLACDWNCGCDEDDDGERTRDEDNHDIVPFLLFSDTKPYEYSKELVAYIKLNKLGRVRVSSEKENPNSGNMLKCYIWEPSRKGLIAWGNNN